MKFLTTSAYLKSIIWIPLLFSTNQLFSQNNVYANSSSGSDASGDGTLGNPYRSFRVAFSNAAAGDTINLNGVFTWTDTEETGTGQATNTGFTISKNIVVRGETTSETIVQAHPNYDAANRRVFTVSALIRAHFISLTIRHGEVALNGGGILGNSGSTLIFDDCILDQNICRNTSTTTGGGAIAINSGTLLLRNSTIKNNLTSSSAAFGGAIFSDGSSSFPGTVTIQNSTIHHNRSERSGAIFCRYSGLDMANTTIAYNNSGTNFSAIYMENFSTVGSWNFGKIINSTITFNEALGTSLPAGLYFSGVTSMELRNNIIARNFNANQQSDYHRIGGTITRTNNIVETSVDGNTDFVNGTNGNITGFQESLNLCEHLALNGNTQSRVHSLALQVGSIAINAGTSTNAPTSDKRGINHDATIDIGAFSFDVNNQFNCNTPIIYVNSNTGSDVTGTGSISAPFRSFRLAYSTAVPFSIIDATGVFTWTDAVETGTGQAATTGYSLTKHMTIRGQGEDQTVFQAHAAYNQADRRVFTVGNSRIINLQDFTIRHGRISTANFGSGGLNISFGSRVTADRLLIEKNIVNGSGTNNEVGGGGIAVGTLAYLNLNNSTVRANVVNHSASNYGNGGGILADGSTTQPTTLIVSNSTISENSTKFLGSGIALFYGTASITNCTVAKNIGGGAAIYLNNLLISSSWNTVNLTQNTIAYNSNIRNNTQTAGVLFEDIRSRTVINNIIAQNFRSSTQQDYSRTGTLTTNVNRNNIIEVQAGIDFTNGTNANRIGVQANLNLCRNLQLNGNTFGKTKTLALLENSIAISNGSTLGTPTVDQRNQSWNTTNDIGSFSYQPSNPPTCNSVPFVWKGFLNTSWNEPLNWEDRFVPSDNDEVIIDVLAANNAILTANTTLTNLSFQESTRKIELGNFNLSINGNVNGANNENFFLTNGTGRLIKQISNNQSFLFPVGRSAYNPVLVSNNSGASDNFSVNILDEVYVNGTSAPTVTANRVQRTWNINKDLPNSGAGVDFIFYWNNGETTAPLASPALFHNNGSVWNEVIGSSSFTSNSFSFSGYTGTFSPFSIAETGSVLPVKWSYFKTRKINNEVEISWGTENEQNSSHFIVEHSTNGQQWNTISTVNAAGTSTALIRYVRTHKNPVLGKNFYRIKQVDLDGGFNYTPILSEQFGTSYSPKVFPNPATGKILIEGMPIDRKTEFQILNAQGQSIMSGILTGNTPYIYIPSQAKGWHIVVIKNQTETHQFRILFQ